MKSEFEMFDLGRNAIFRGNENSTKQLKVYLFVKLNILKTC
jgi:hypothetical protein